MPRQPGKYDEAVKRASRMGSKPDPDLLRWALTTYCSKNGDIRATFAAMGDDPAEALKELERKTKADHK